MKAVLILIPAVLFFSCSLKYGTTYQDEDNVPEFVFTDAKFNRYENNRLSMSLSASRLEQYGDGKSTYAKDVNFEVLDDEGKLETSGQCSLLSANSDTENYVLYDDIIINNVKDEMIVTADSLKWNGKSEQLTSSRNDMVTLKKGNTTLHGSGFSASGVSKKFQFTGVVTGEFTKEEEKQNEEN